MASESGLFLFYLSLGKQWLCSRNRALRALALRRRQLRYYLMIINGDPPPEAQSNICKLSSNFIFSFSLAICREPEEVFVKICDVMETSYKKGFTIVLIVCFRLVSRSRTLRYCAIMNE